MNRKAYCPGTDVKVTDPTFWVECTHCGYKRIHLLKEKKCPACSKEVVCRALTEINESEDRYANNHSKDFNTELQGY